MFLLSFSYAREKGASVTKLAATQIQFRKLSLEVVVDNSYDLSPAIIVDSQASGADLRHFPGKGEHQGIWAEGQPPIHRAEREN